MTVMVWDKIRTPHMIKSGFVPIIARGHEPNVALVPHLKRIEFRWHVGGTVFVYTIESDLWLWALDQQPGN